jgi:c(7)-type cytochrome triheme protein
MKKIAAVTACIVLMGIGTALAAVGGDDITMKSKGGDVLFRHATHVEEVALACTECHDKLYLSKGQHKVVTMKQMQKGKSCGTCHNGKKAFSVKGDCAKCHKK